MTVSDEGELLRRTGLTRSERSLRGRSAVNKRWGLTPDRLAATKKMRDAAFARFLKQADPEGVLSEAERYKRARSLERSHMQNIACERERNRRLRRGDNA
jgi:hypothetical protein